MPDQIKELIVASKGLPPELFGMIMSMVMAALRVIYDQEETRPLRVILEGLICGGLSLTASFAIRALGLDINWSIVAGGTIGYFGSLWVREQAIRVLRKKVG